MPSWISRLNNWDKSFFRNIFGRSEHPWIRRCFRVVSHSADGWLYPLIPASLFLVNHPQAFSFFLVGMLAFVIELPLYRLIKNGVRRRRPFNKLEGIKNRVVPPDEFSFPSGHSSAAFMIATLVTYYFPHLAIPAYAWAFLVGFSRVLLGVHYPSDVLAGVSLGIFSSTLAIYLVA